MLKSSFKNKSKSAFALLLGLAFLIPSTNASALSTESIGNSTESSNSVLSTPEPSDKVLTKGIYEETDEGITYSGNWTSQQSSSFSGDSGIYSLTPGSYATFKFEGTGFSWYGLSTPNRGIASITIDDGVPILVDTATSSIINKNNIYTCTGLTFGTHTVKITITNDKNDTSEAFSQFIDYLQIYASDPVDKILEPGKYEENDEGLHYYGVWTDQENESFSGGSGKYSLSPGSYVTFKFEGVGFSWYAYATSNRGIANITIDDKTYTMDTSSKYALAKKDVYTITNLDPGVHTAKIEVTNNKNDTSNSITQFIDSLEIYEKDPVQVLTAGKYEENNDAIKYYGSWIEQDGKYNSAAHGKYSLTPGSYFSFSFEGTGFSWYAFATINRGFANIFIDGVPYEMDTSSPVTLYKKNVYTINGLEYGRHDVKIEVTDKKQKYSSMVTQFIDYIQIYDHDTILTVGKHEDSDEGLHYSGNWMNHFSDSDSDGIGKYSYEEGSDVSFTFKGTGFSWYSLVTPNRGIAKVTIDGTEYTVNTADSTIASKKELFTQNNLEAGIHNVKIEVTGRKDDSATVPTVFIDYINVYDNTEVIPNVLQPGMYQEDDDYLTYTGNWITQSHDNFMEGSGKYSFESNSSVLFTFEGTGFNWYSYSTPNRGIAKIIIDDEIIDTIDNSSPVTEFQKIVYSKSGLNNGIHKVQIVVTGDKSPNSTTTTQFIDAIEILS